MPKNTKGGKKHKMLKNDNSKGDISRIVLKDDTGYQYYAIVYKYYGHNADVKFIKDVIKGSDTLYINQSTKTQDKDSLESEQIIYSCKAIIRGAIAKTCRLKPNDIILVSMRDYDNRKVDVLYKYSDDEVKYLLSNNLFSEEFITLYNSFDSYSNSGSSIVNKIDSNYKNKGRENDVMFVDMYSNNLILDTEEDDTETINYDNI